MAGTKTGQGLGYYIHYRAQNYRDYGIVPKNSNKSGISAQQAILNTHDRLFSLIQDSKMRTNSSDLQRLENFLNKLGIGEYQDAMKLLGEDTNIDFAAIISDIVTEIQKDYPNFIFDFETSSLESFVPKVKNLYVKKEKDPTGKQRKRINVETVIRLQETLSNILNETTERINKLRLSKIEIQNLNNIQKKTQDLQLKLAELMTNPEFTESKKYIRLNSKNKSDKIVGQIIAGVKELVDSIPAPNSNDIGIASEKALALLFLKIAQETDKQTSLFLEDI